MLHILLLVLKMIGIILAVILGILVLLVCIVVFVPIRYEIDIRCGGALSTLKGKGRVTWLFSLVRADICYKEDKLKWRLRIAWRKISGGQRYGADTSLDRMWDGTDTQNERTEGEEHERRNEESKENDEEAWKYGFEEDEERKESKESDEEAWRYGAEKDEERKESKKCDEEAWHKPGKSEKGREKYQEEFVEDEESFEEIPESIEEEVSGDEKGAWEDGGAYEDRDWEDGGRIKSIIRKIKGIYGRIKCTIQAVCGKIKELLEKKDRLLGFIREECHAGAFWKVKKEVFKLFKRLRPKRFLVKARFGFEDPSWTGRLLAAIAPFCPLFGEFVSLKPDFTEKVLEGKLYAKGRIRFCHFAAFGWNLLWSKNVRRTYKDIKNFEL